MHAHTCTYMDRCEMCVGFLVSEYTLIHGVGPEVAQAARSWLVEGISTGSVQSDIEYDIFDADADSTATGQGSTRDLPVAARRGAGVCRVGHVCGALQVPATHVGY